MRQAFALAQMEFDALTGWTIAAIDASLKRIAGALGKKLRDVMRPFYVAITGSPTSVPLYDAMEILGRDIVRERLRMALELLGKPSAKELEEWRKLLPTEAQAEVLA